MKIGFDLDGVLRTLDLFPLRICKEISDDYDMMKWYYMLLKPELNPFMFLSEDDEAYIISMQKDRDRELTEKWLRKFLPTITAHVLVHNWNASDWKAQNSEKINNEWSSQKATKIKELGLEVFFEDDPQVVKQLRELCPETKIIQYGGRLLA